MAPSIRPPAFAVKIALLVLAAAVLAAAAPLIVTAPAASSAPKARSCGTKLLYGKPLQLRVLDKKLDCAQVRRIVHGACVVGGPTWTCFPWRETGPALEWYRSRAVYSGHLSAEIEALRYPCAEADVTPDAWATARRRISGYPSRAEVLADDTLRCHRLVGKDRLAIVALLGSPDDHEGTRWISYDLGMERDTLFPIDNEILAITLDRHGRFARAEFVQT